MTSVLVGYDGSPSAAGAIRTAAPLLPGARATVAHLWTPPFGDPRLRHRLWLDAASVDELASMIEREGDARARQVAADGVALATAAGWEAEPLTRRIFGGEGYELARVAEELSSDVLLVGTRGLGGVRAVLGSTSDVAVHVSRVPVAVVPQPLLSLEPGDTADRPVVVGYDGSAGARAALEAAARLFGDRRLLVVTVGSIDAQVAEHETLEAAQAGAGEIVTVQRAGGGERGIAAALVAVAGEREAALLVVGSRGRSAGREILLGSVAMAVLHSAQRPVMVVPHARFG